MNIYKLNKERKTRKPTANIDIATQSNQATKQLKRGTKREYIKCFDFERIHLPHINEDIFNQYCRIMHKLNESAATQQIDQPLAVVRNCLFTA